MKILKWNLALFILLSLWVASFSSLAFATGEDALDHAMTRLSEVHPPLVTELRKDRLLHQGLAELFNNPTLISKYANTPEEVRRITNKATEFAGSDYQPDSPQFAIYKKYFVGLSEDNKRGALESNQQFSLYMAMANSGSLEGLSLLYGLGAPSDPVRLQNYLDTLRLCLDGLDAAKLSTVEVERVAMKLTYVAGTVRESKFEFVREAALKLRNRAFEWKALSTQPQRSAELNDPKSPRNAGSVADNAPSLPPAPTVEGSVDQAHERSPASVAPQEHTSSTLPIWIVLAILTLAIASFVWQRRAR